MDVHIREDRVQAGMNPNPAKSERLFEKWLDAVYNTDAGFESRIAPGVPYLKAFYQSLLSSITGSRPEEYLTYLEDALHKLIEASFSRDELTSMFAKFRELIISQFFKNEQLGTELLIEHILRHFDKIFDSIRGLIFIHKQFQNDAESMTLSPIDWNIPSGVILIDGSRFDSPGLANLTLYHWLNLKSMDYLDPSVWKRVIPPGDLRRIQTELKERYQQNKCSYRIEYHLRNRDGQAVPVVEEGDIRYTSSGEPLQIKGIIYQSPAEGPSLSETKSNVADQPVSQSGAASLVCDKDGVIQEINQAFSEMIGFPQQEILSTKLIDWMPPLYQKIIQNTSYFLEQSAQREKTKLFLLDKKQEKRLWEVSIVINKKSPEKKNFLISTFEEKAAVISVSPNREFNRRLQFLVQIQKDLALSKDYKKIFTNILTSARQLIPAVDAGSILRIEPEGMRYVAALNYDLEQLKKVGLLQNNADMQKRIGTHRRLIEESRVAIEIKAIHQESKKSWTPAQYNILKKYGKLESIRSTLCGLLFLNQKPYAIVNLDIIEEEGNFSYDDKILFDLFIRHVNIILQNVSLMMQIQESETMYRTLFEHSPVSVYIEQNKKIVLANQKFSELSGYPLKEIRSRSLQDFFPAAAQKAIAQSLNEHMSGNFQDKEFSFQIETKNKEEHNCLGFFTEIQYQGKPATLGKIMDVTHNKILENQLLQSQKMDTIGTLTAGIAHDFNNILGAISPSAQLIMMDPQNANTRQRAEVIYKMSQRANVLTRQLLSFARLDHVKNEPINLNEVIESNLPLINKSIIKDIVLELNLDKKLKAVEGDNNQFIQILMNLVVNARDAMQDGGHLRIITKNVNVDKTYRQLDPDFQTGAYVYLAVQDTGCGIPPNIKNKIFDPFFTTKKVGKGTGLGLSMVYGITKSYSGIILVKSQVNEGTVFELFFPASNQQVKKIAPAPVEEPVKGTGTILVVDDEEELREVYNSLLRFLGYNVYLAASGKEGIEIFRTKKDKIDLVLLDYIMPDLNGHQTFLEMKKISKDINCLICSGYSEQQGIRELHANGIKGILTKPFTLQTISKKLGEVLRSK